MIKVLCLKINFNKTIYKKIGDRGAILLPEGLEPLGFRHLPVDLPILFFIHLGAGDGTQRYTIVNHFLSH